jgi:hypothetical protein
LHQPTLHPLSPRRASLLNVPLLLVAGVATARLITRRGGIPSPEGSMAVEVLPRNYYELHFRVSLH